MAANPYRVFLSYAAADSEIARRVADELKGAGLPVWFDQLEIQPGESFAERIGTSLSSSSILAVFLSTESIQSKWVNQEITTALAQELRSRAITVIPCILDNCQIPPALANLTSVDFRSDFRGGVKRLIEQISFAPDIDFTRLTPLAFQKLVEDVFHELGFSLLNKDLPLASGFDFVASLSAIDSAGRLREEHWLVETKLYRDQRVSINSIHQMADYIANNPSIDRGVIVTNGQLTSVAREFLTGLIESSGTILRVLEGTDLTDLLLQHPALVSRHFTRFGNHESRN